MVFEGMGIEDEGIMAQTNSATEFAIKIFHLYSNESQYIDIQKN